MKKLFILILTLIVCVFAFASCKNGTTNNENPNKNPGQNTTSDNTIWTNGTRITVIMNEELNGISQDIFNYIKLSDDIYDATNTIPRVFYTSDIPEQTAHELLIGQTTRAITAVAYDRLDTYLYGTGSDKYSGWIIYAKDGSLAIAYDCELAMRDAISYLKTDLLSQSSLEAKNGILASSKFNYRDKVAEMREAERTEAFDKAEKQLYDSLDGMFENDADRKALAKDTINALRSLYTIYTDEVYIWMSDLWDPKNGGFYYSNSGRNNLGFLPDVESTAQLLSFLDSSGLFKDAGGWVNGLPADMKTKILNFVKSLQSSEDGYFYHPQWGKEIISARRGRDLGWSTSLIKQLGGKPYYDAPDGTKGELGAPGASASMLTSKFTTSISASVSKLASSIKATSKAYLPEYLQSLSAWKDYIIDLDIPHRSYEAGNTLAAQHGQISLAGAEYEDLLIEYLNEIQLENGLWEPQVDYNSVNGLMKLISSYNYYSKPFPRAEEALKSTIEVAINPDGHTHVCSIYNPWVAMNLVLSLTEKAEGEARANELRETILPYMPELINVTYDKLQVHIVKGGFHYHKDLLANTSQAAAVGCAEEFEADVNATAICTTGITGNLFDVLGIDYVNLYYREDRNQFMKELSNLDEVIKNVPKPVKPETFDYYDISDGNYVNGVVTYPAGNAEITLNDTTVGSDGLYKYYRANVLTDPKAVKPNDLALNIKNLVYDTESGSKEYAEAMSSVNFNITNGYVLGSTYLLDTDIMVEDSDINTFAQLFMMSTSNGFSINFTVYEEDVIIGEDEEGNPITEKQKFIRIWENFIGADGYKDNNIVDGIPLGEWFNLRIELYKIYATEEGATKKNLDIVAKIFINDEFVGTSDAFYTLKSDPSVFADNTVTLFKFALYRSCNSSVWLDNVKIEKSQKNYEFQQVEIDAEDIPESIPTPEGSAVGGIYYNTNTSLGKKYDFDALVKTPGLTNGTSAKTYIHEITTADEEVNGIIYFYKTYSGENAKDEATTHTFPAPIEYPENTAIIGEFDFALGGIPSSTNGVFRVNLNGNGYGTSIYMGTDENGSIKFENVAGNTSYTVPMAQNKWYNIRFEAYLLSEISMNIKVYINGVYALDLKAANFKASSSSSIQMQWQANAPDTGWVLYDNLFIGYDTKEYVYPDGVSPSDEPEFNPPAGTHGGGVLYNDNKYIGKRVDFSDRSQLQIMLNSSGGESTVSTLLVDGAVLYQRTDTLAHDNVVYQFALAEEVLTVAEFDIAFSGLEGSTAGFISFYTGKTYARSYQLYFHLVDGKIRFGNDETYIHVADDYQPIVENTWYNLRFELYILNDGSAAAKVYVNSEYAFTVKAILGSRTNSGRVIFQLNKTYANSSIMIDNIYMGDHKKNYTVGETGEPESPIVYPETDITLGGTHEGGAVYNSDASGSRFNFDNTTDPLPIPSNTSEVKIHRNDGGFLVLEQVGKTSGYVTFNYPATRPTPDAEHRVVNIAEFDVLLGGVDTLEANTLVAKILLYTKEGHRTSAYFTYNKETGKLNFPTPNKGITEGALISIDPTVWNNFRFEYRVIGDRILSDLYVNGTFAATFIGEDNKTADSDMLRISFHNGAPNGGVWYALDNIYTGFKTEEIPKTPRVDGPDGVIGTHSGGAVFNSEAIGTRFDFEGLMVDVPSSSNVSSSSTGLTTDGYIYFKQLGDPAQSYVEFAYPSAPTAEAEKTLINILELDTFIGGVESMTSDALVGRIIVHGGGKNTSFYFNYNTKTGLIEMPKWGTVTEGEMVTFSPNTWNNFRFEYSLINGEIVADFYLNGVYAASFKGSDSKTSSANKVQIYFHNTVNTTFYGIDNIYLGHKVDSILESSAPLRGTGVYYKDTENKAGKRWDMNSSTLKNNYTEWWMTKDTTGAIVSSYASGGDQTLYVRRTATDTSQFTLGYRNTDITATTAHPVNHITVVEYDIKFNGMPASTEKIWQFNIFTGGAIGRRGTLYFGTDENGKVVINSMGSVYTAIKLEQDTWYNLRFTLDLNGNCKIYVNGILQTYIKNGETLDAFTPDNGFTEKNGYSRMEANFTNTSVDVNCGIFVDNFFLGADVIVSDNETTDPDAPGDGGEITNPDEETEGGETTNPGESETTPIDSAVGNGVYYNAEKIDAANHYGQNFSSLVASDGGLTVTEDTNGIAIITGEKGKGNTYRVGDQIAANGKTVIYEMDLCFVSSSGVWDYNFTTDIGGKSFELCFGAKNGSITTANITKVHFADDFDGNFPTNEWFNLRIEIYTIENSNYIKYYVNNEYVATYTPNSTKTTANNTRLYLKFQSADLELKMTNLYIGGADIEYVDESLDANSAQ